MYTVTSWSFALFSANLYRYLPSIPWEQHKIIYSKWKTYHRDQPLPQLLWRRNVSPQLHKTLQSPCIISLFHLSDHLVWPVLLAKNGICFNVLLDRTVYADAKVVFDQLLQELSAYGHKPELLFSDDPTLLLKIRSRRTKGQHLLCFVDGASGASTVGKDDRIPITFLGGTLWLKKGIPFISHLFGMPVVSLLPHKVGHEQQLQIDKTILPDPYETREAYIFRCLHELYRGLEKRVKNAPHAWECWGYLHRNGLLGKINDRQFVGADTTVVQVEWQGKLVAFDRVNYALKME